LKANVVRVVALACCVLCGSLSESPPWLPGQCADGGAGPLLKLAARQSIRVQPERPSSGHAPWAIGRLAE
jgi:hypothetical protein